jgi:hypothetical protein
MNPTQEERKMIATRIGSVRQRMYVSTTDTFDDDLGLDLVAIERAMNGDAVRLTRGEKIRAAELLDARGLTLTNIGRFVGTDRWTVSEWKAGGWKEEESAPLPRARREPPKCGTRQGYRRHRSRKEESCRDCREANAAADRRFRITGSTKDARGTEEER